MPHKLLEESGVVACFGVPEDADREPAGWIFDVFGSYRSLFVLMAAYTTLAFVAVLFIPRGAGEAGTGPDGAAASRQRGA